MKISRGQLALALSLPADPGRSPAPARLPIYLSGSIRAGIGAMVTPRMRQRPPVGVDWAADTGCFAKPEEYSVARQVRWLHELGADGALESCLFATAPDAFGDGERTLALFAMTHAILREVAPRVALVAQPTMRARRVPWDDLDALFVGGPNTWQHSEACARLAAEAKRRGKWLHVGRVNTRTRLRIAAAYGADSVDGTFLAFGPDVNLPRLVRWYEELAADRARAA